MWYLTCFVAVWLAELAWWRADPLGFRQRRPWVVWAVRIFAAIVVFNAAVIFAAPDRRVAGAAVVAALVIARRFERRLEDAAERALPGPLQGPEGCAPVAAEGE